MPKCSTYIKTQRVTAFCSFIKHRHCSFLYFTVEFIITGSSELRCAPLCGKPSELTACVLETPALNCQPVAAVGNAHPEVWSLLPPQVCQEHVRSSCESSKCALILIADNKKDCWALPAQFSLKIKMHLYSSVAACKAGTLLPCMLGILCRVFEMSHL